ncbi:hypothetical protein GCM10009682_11510 [Luedemannella flava]|uniref:Uncharacterized protein n=1 Tax=Luedemannella flava TaxID=349316 RepID=A0ABN2LJW6_9ACTN
MGSSVGAAAAVGSAAVGVGVGVGVASATGVPQSPAEPGVSGSRTTAAATSVTTTVDRVSATGPVRTRLGRDNDRDADDTWRSSR